MNWMRISIVIIVVYVLGLGTGIVLGVVLSFKELSVPAVAATSAPSPSPVASLSPALPVGPGGFESPSPSGLAASPSPSGLAASPSPSGPGASPSLSDRAATPTPSGPPGGALAPSPAEVASGRTASPATSASSAAPAAVTPASATPAATLMVSVNKGDGFKIFVDGEARGTAPANLEVRPGPHHVKVLGGARFTNWEAQLSIPAGETRRLEAMLTLIPTHAAPAPARRAPPPAPAYRAAARHESSGRPEIEGQQRF